MREPAYLVALLAAVALALGACELIEQAPRVQVIGGRQLVIPVNNGSDRPAVLVVAEDRMPIGPEVGTSQPQVVPPKTRADAVFTVPSTRTWAIFVNPGPEQGPLIIASDVERCVGVLPIEINVGPGGELSWGGARDPWCGSQ